MNELIQALAREIRQTSLWLAKEKTTDLSSIRFRLHTLREAASTAEMRNVEQALGRLESRLESARGDGLDEILGHLSKLLFELAQPVYKNEKLWLAEFDDIESDLSSLTTSMDQCMDRLMNMVSVADNVLLQTDGEIYSESLMELSRGIRDEIIDIQNRRTNASVAAEKLHHISVALMKDFSSNNWIPIDIAFARFRQKVRAWSKENTKPVALRSKADKVRVGMDQYEHFLGLLDIILDEIMTNGLDDPEDRSKAGKPTVAKIFIEASQKPNLIQLAISHDGLGLNQHLALPAQAEKNLKKLRGWLWMDERKEVGQRLMLQFPLWHSITEAVKIQCEVGVAFVPLSVIQRLDVTQSDTSKKIPRIHLDRRAGTVKNEHFSNGLIFSLGYWQGFLPCNILSPAKRIIIDSAWQTEPLWMLGWTRSDGEKYPVIHPLTLAPIPSHWRYLYPMETKS